MMAEIPLSTSVLLVCIGATAAYVCGTEWYKIVPAVISIILGAVGLVSATLGWKYIAHMITILVAAFGYVVWTTGKILCALGVVGSKLVRFGRLAFDRKTIFALIMGAAAATTHLAMPTGALLMLGRMTAEQAKILTIIVDNSASGNVTKTLDGEIEGTRDHSKRAPFTQGNGELMVEFTFLARRDYVGMVKGPTVTIPPSLILFSDADLQVRSRYCILAFLNYGCIYSLSRLQHSIAVDITESEAFGYAIAAVMAEVLRGYMEDLGLGAELEQLTPIVTDNDATLRIASDAASAKRALHILRRFAHVRQLTARDVIKALPIDGTVNPANGGTKYTPGPELTRTMKHLRNM